MKVKIFLLNNNNKKKLFILWNELQFAELIRMRSFFAVRIAKFGLLREPIRIFLLHVIADQFSHIINLISRILVVY